MTISRCKAGLSDYRDINMNIRIIYRRVIALYICGCYEIYIGDLGEILLLVRHMMEISFE